MTVRILADSMLSNRIGALVFPAVDDDGPLKVWVTPTRWEQLWI
jgi:hypothetical protein